MSWGPVGRWDARLRALGTEPGTCGDRSLTLEVAADGLLTVALEDGAERLVGAWRAAGPGRVVVRIRSAELEVEAVAEVVADGQSFAGRASIRGSRRGESSRARPGMAEVTGRRPLP